MSGKMPSEGLTLKSDEFAKVPGGRHVKFLQNKSSEFYCTKHNCFIWPLYLLQDGFVWPVCEDCFLEDLQDRQQFLGDCEEVSDVVENIVSETVLETDAKNNTIPV